MVLGIMDPHFPDFGQTSYYSHVWVYRTVTMLKYLFYLDEYFGQMYQPGPLNPAQKLLPLIYNFIS